MINVQPLQCQSSPRILVSTEAVHIPISSVSPYPTYTYTHPRHESKTYAIQEIELDRVPSVHRELQHWHRSGSSSTITVQVLPTGSSRPRPGVESGPLPLNACWMLDAASVRSSESVQYWQWQLVAVAVFGKRKKKKRARTHDTTRTRPNGLCKHHRSRISRGVLFTPNKSNSTTRSKFESRYELKDTRPYVHDDTLLIPKRYYTVRYTGIRFSSRP